MEFYLMHKNIVVASMELDLQGDLSKLRRNLSCGEHCPLGGQMNDMKFHQWWKDRAIPKTRKGSSYALRQLGFQSTNSLLVNNLALSLNDCYWIKPASSNIFWEQVSLFRNNFVDIFGELTFDTTKNLDLRGKTVFRFASSQGELQKKWCIDENGNRFLVKGNWGTSYQQSLNEVFATHLHIMQGVNNITPYFLTLVDVEDNQKGIGCFSYNFCNENVEFISAWELLQTVKIKQNESWYNVLKKICVERLGFSETYVDNFLGYEIMTDFIMSNTDRHMNNIGVLRNPDTLEYIGFAPIYDTGNSMFFRSATVPTAGLLGIKTHSFVEKEVNLLKYAKDRSLVDLSKVPNYDLFASIYLKDIPERHCRIEDMYKAYQQKLYYLSDFQNGKDIWKESNKRYYS